MISYATAEVCEARPVSASVSLELTSGNVESLQINTVSSYEQPLVVPTIAGYIGNAYEFSVDGTFESAEISFYYDSSVGSLSEDFQPRIYYLNEETKMLEELPEQNVVEGKVTVRVEHFSTYILLNSVEFDKVWEEEIKPPVDKDNKKTGLDVVFVIDSSGSMQSSDATNLRISAAKKFISKLGINDRGAVVDFDHYATLYQGFTDNHEALNNAVDFIDSSGGTDLRTGMLEAIGLFTNADYQRTDAYKYVIFLTDGQGTYNDQYTKLAADNDIVVYTIGLGSYVDSALLKKIAEGTNGKYYFASTAHNLEEIYDDISYETIDYITDSNNDGISDYYTSLIKEGKLRVSNSSDEFRNIDFNYDKNGNISDDYDGDGLKNGEEIMVEEQYGETVIIMKSNPVLVNSDGDDYEDFEEVEQKSDPLNYSVDSRAVNFFTNSYNFYYEDIAELIDDGALRAYNDYAAVIYGVWDKEELYRDLIIDYYTNYATQDMMESEELEEQKKLWTDTLYTFLDNASDVSQSVTNGYSYVTSIYGLIDYVKGAQSLEELKEAFCSRVTLLIIEMNKISEDATLMRFEVNGLEYQKHLLDFDKVKSAVACSYDVMDKICTGVAFTSYGLDILDTVVEVSKVRANNKVFATNMDALIRISIQSKDENISNAAYQIEQELAANYLGAISVFGNDIIENAVKEVVRYASTKNIYVFAVVATRDLIDLAFGVSNDIKQEYKILCYSEISKAYVDLISDMGMVSKNNNYYNVPEYSVIRFKRYMVNIEQLRVIGEIEYYNFYKCEGIFSKLGDWVYDTKSVKDLINAQLSNIKDWVDLLPLVLSEKIKYKI